MKRIFSIVLVGLLLSGTLFASTPLNGELGRSEPTRYTAGTLDEQCTIDFTQYTYGSVSGSMTWPGGSGQYRLTGLCFENSCTPGVPLYAYCTDLDHALIADPYCVEIDPAVINPLYPDQYPALAYVLTHYAVTNDVTDRIMQLSIWKLSNDWRTGPTYGVPFVYTDAGRGYPNLGDVPAYPYVNTVYNNDAAINDPANTRIRDALGYPDGLPKNVILCGDVIEILVGDITFVGDNAEATVTFSITRGAAALAVGNTETSGIRLDGVLSGALNGSFDRITSATGTATLDVSVPIGSPALTITVCSRGLWPYEIVPCEGQNGQRLLVQQLQTTAACTTCASVTIQADDWLGVELAAFTAVGSTNGIDLSWSTAAEQQTARWEIERTASGPAGFVTIAQLPASNSPSGASYRYLDAGAAAGTSYDYRLVDVDLSGTRTVHNERVVTAALPFGVIDANGYELADNFPNPFNPETSIRFSLAERGQTTLTVFDLSGSAVATLVDGQLDAGAHAVTFDAATLPSGTYFYKLVTPGFSATKKMILMK